MKFRKYKMMEEKRMEVNALIGRKVIQGGFRGNGEGTIVAVEGDIISIDFNGAVKKFSMEIFIKSLTFYNDETRELMEQAIAEAGSAFTGGSLYSTVAADIATRMTRDRVYELLEYLP
jgi:hypothetical protein